VYPEINIGPLTLQTFGLMFALAFLAAGALIAKRLAEIGKPADWAYEMGFSALAGGIVGSRVYFIVQNYDEVKHDLVGKLFSGAGLVWYGGAIGGALAVLLWAHYRRFLGLALLDLAAPALALGYAIGRCGCQLSGDGDYGKAWHGPWAMSYPDGTVPTDTDLRDPRDGAWRLAALAAARPLPHRRPLRHLPRLRRDRALSGRVPAAQPRRRPRPHRGPAREPGDDDRRGRLDLRGQAPPR
jgi:prolipoprotein diacylglyceryltransferase